MDLGKKIVVILNENLCLVQNEEKTFYDKWKQKLTHTKILVKVNQKNYQLIAMDNSSLNYITISLVVFINFISFKLSFVHPHMTAISDILGCYQNGNISF